MKASNEVFRLVPQRIALTCLVVAWSMLFGSVTLLAAQQPAAVEPAHSASTATGNDANLRPGRGPVLASFEIAQGAILLHFAQADGGLKLKNSGRGAFEIAGTDHHWFPAEAHLVNGMIVVSTSLLQLPTVVRYRWSDRKTAALFDGHDVAVEPFQTEK